MKRLRKAPTGATNPPRVPSTDRDTPSVSHAAPPEPSGSPPSPFSLFRFKDADDAAEWLRLVRGNADDLAALAHEGGRRLARRVLSRAELRRQARAAQRCMHDLLAEAEAGLTPAGLVAGAEP